MNIVILIVHKNPKQVIRLCERLSLLNTLVFVNIDKKSNDAFCELKKFNNIVFCSKKSIFLDDRSLVDIVITLAKKSIKYCAKNKIKIKRFMVLSGQDYPIKPLQTIKNELDTNHSIIDMNEMSSTYWIYKKIQYNQLYYFSKNVNRKYRHNIILKIISIILYKFSRLIMNRNTIYNSIKRLKIYGGSAWFSLTYDHMAYCIHEYDKKSYLSRKILLSATPEELYFQTILANSKYFNDIVSHKFNYMFANFAPNGLPDTGHPYILQFNDLDRIYSLDYLFARKFDTDENVLNSLDDLYFS